ncbi:DEAD-box ATP-dependent RNA helicase 29 [Panicum miliaceum]|uniref:RNA helicase n=1 Tax=Panicum miliaceum TaxID=4540 RepID=A0A3L6RIT2_PANMI|nr:DEAD-box ATP-dependent RNA helicase 29 [Panicum miliaceum]
MARLTPTKSKSSRKPKPSSSSGMDAAAEPNPEPQRRPKRERSAGGGGSKKSGGSKKAKSGGFESMGLCEEVYRGVRHKGYRVPTPIQRKTMPLILAGVDVAAMARTGSGKTAAFLLPMLHRLRRRDPGAGVRALILSPTRDLAMQTLKFTKQLGKFTDLRTSVIVGGDSMESQFEELAECPDIIIATPGRLMHHLNDVKDMTLRSVEYVVFDEADSLFSMGFAKHLHDILKKLSDTRQTLLFSATLPSALADFAKAGLRDPQIVRLDLDKRISPDLKLVFFTLRQEEKLAALLYLVRERISSEEQTIIFVSTKHHVEFLNILFREEGLEPSLSYGAMDQEARMIHISKFRARKTMLLIVTDVAARGLDIPLLDNVVNWDFPAKPKLFVHRVGRVARQGRSGTAYTFVTSEDMPYLLDLHLFLSRPLKPAPTEEELLKDMDNINMKIDQAIANGESVYGRFPQTVLDLVSDGIKEVISGCTELISLEKPCANAFRLYLKTRAMPSKESIKRAKDLPREGLHPIFRDVLRSDELSALAFSERLKSFRPKQTILEAEGEAAKTRNSKGSNQWLDVMKKKREVHEGIINLVHQKSSVDPRPEEEDDDISNWEKKEVCGMKRKSQSFRDEDYYISSVPQNQHLEAGLSVRNNEGFVENRLDAAVLDLVDDEASGMQAHKTRYHWMKNKFVKLNNGDRVTATGKIKTEGGAKIKASATGIYKRWQQRTHKSINIGGKSGSFAEEGTPRTGGYHGGNKKHFPGGRGRRSIPNANVPSEIRNPEQMQKSRQQKAMEITRLKNKSAKDGKFQNKFQKNRRPDGNGKGRGNGKGAGKGGFGKGPGKGGKGKGKVKGKGGR